MSSDDKLIIETPEQTVLEFPLAGIGSRALALVIDTLLQIGVLVAIALVAGLRVALQPVADRGPGDGVFLHHAHLDQHVADCRIGPVILTRIGDANTLAVVERDAPRSLNMQKENRHRIVAIKSPFNQGITRDLSP